MTRVPPPGDHDRGLTRRTWANSYSRTRAGKPFELTFKDKIYLRRMRDGMRIIDVSRALGISRGTIWSTVNAAAQRFGVKDAAELLAREDVQQQLDGD